MDSSVIIEVSLGLLSVAVGFVTFLAASKSQNQQHKAEQSAVDAAAYGRAMEIYESALQTLRDELSTTRSELITARNEIVSLREEISHLRSEIRLTGASGTRD